MTKEHTCIDSTLSIDDKIYGPAYCCDKCCIEFTGNIESSPK